MAKTVKKTKKAASKKDVVKSTAKKSEAKASKPVARKEAPKPVAKKTIAKPAVKKAAPKPVAKKVAEKAPAKKAVAKPVTKKSAVKAVAKKTVAKPAAKKAVTKPVAKKSAAKQVKKAPVKKVVTNKKESKPVVKKSVSKKIEDKTTRIAQHRKKIQEIKNNYDGPVSPVVEDDDYGNYRPNIIGRTRFSDAELLEFRILINKKIAEAREELNFYQEQMKESEMNDDDIKFSGMEDGGHTNDKEHLSSMANRQIKFIQNLEAAIVRIENKTYGICRMTGNLIAKQRLMAVPHATLSMEAKTGGKKK